MNSQSFRVCQAVKFRVFIPYFLLLSFALLTACTTPPPVTPEQLEEQGGAFLEQMASRRETLPESLTLETALARALADNLEFRVRSLEQAIAGGEADLASMDMLPRLTASAGYTGRNNVQGSFSQSVESGNVSLVPSTSSEDSWSTRSLEASWNLMDFGLAWFRGRTKGEEANIALEERRRAVHMVTRDLVYAWQRVAVFQSVRDEVMAIDTLVREALHKSAEIMERRLRDPVRVLEYRKSLLLVLKRINALVTEMERAEADLARLLGLPAGLDLRVEQDGDSFMDRLEPIEAPLEVWQLAALLYRPEVRSAFYEVRNADRDGWQRFLESMPRLVFNYSGEYNSNKFLVNNYWREKGVTLGWDLMKLASYPLQRRQSEFGRKLAEARRELQMTAVLSQVAVADKMLESSDRSHCISRTLADVDEARISMMEARQSQASLDRLTLIKARADNLLLRVERGMDAAEQARSVVMMLASAGMELVPLDVNYDDPEVASARLRTWFREGLPRYVRAVLDEAALRFDAAQLSARPVSLGGFQCFSG